MPSDAEIVALHRQASAKPGGGEDLDVLFHNVDSVADVVTNVLATARGDSLTDSAGGRFAIGHLRSGEYTLEIVVGGEEPRRFKVAVPAPDYVLEI